MKKIYKAIYQILKIKLFKETKTIYKRREKKTMSTTYYEYEKVKVKIAHRLFNMDGWTVYGWHNDNSDPMTDYYDPAYWDGIAEKNGYRLVVDKFR